MFVEVGLIKDLSFFACLVALFAIDLGLAKRIKKLEGKANG
ncbi:hypothetical protein [Halomonas stenophila]|uniref:Uncharacterized protein n=1 Tax=Halomonas stenophila TaxID=795312 RepID=A0A7W5ET79_9GAMM|nr:hypothetical protein [Halomonas stenophila]MBB3231062.1 hypothetical protein [Halomonas stenophila]